MVKNKITFQDWLQTGVIRLCRLHFWLIALYAIYTIISDGTHLITPELVLQRWTMNALLLTVTVIIWYLARNKVTNSNYYRLLIYVLILADIAMASFNVYTQRGMASRAVMMYALPIVVSAVLLSRTAIFMTSALCTAAYSLAAVRYFVVNFNEGYKAELYSEVGFYCGCFFLLAAILTVLVRFKNTESGLGL
jgi:hypothetical protein